MRITLRQLQVFVHTANLNSLSEAANACHITQSAASMALQELESSLNKPLFDRVGKRLRLNSHGQTLLPKATAILDQANTLESQTFGLHHGIIKVGASTTIGNYVLPKYLARFNQHHPDVSFNLFISNTDTVLAKISDLELDFAFIEGACNAPKIIKTKWLLDELKIVCRANHVLAKKAVLNLKDLNPFSWVTREIGSGTRERFNQALEDKINMKSEIILNNPEAIKNYILNSNCLGYLSAATLDHELKTKILKVLQIKNLVIKRYFYKVSHSEKYQSELVKTFDLFFKGGLEGM